MTWLFGYRKYPDLHPFQLQFPHLFSLSPWRNLTSLTLFDESRPGILLRFFENLVFLAELKELTLRNIDIEEDSLVALSTYLLQAKQLESLRLDTVIYRREIQVSDLGFAIFKQALKSSTLRKLLLKILVSVNAGVAITHFVEYLILNSSIRQFEWYLRQSSSIGFSLSPAMAVVPHCKLESLDLTFIERGLEQNISTTDYQGLNAFFATTKTLRSFAIRADPKYTQTEADIHSYHTILHCLFSSLSANSECPIETLHIENLSFAAPYYLDLFSDAMNEFISKNATLRQLKLLNFRGNVNSAFLLANPSLTLLDMHPTDVFWRIRGFNEMELVNTCDILPLYRISTLMDIAYPVIYSIKCC